MLLVVAVALPHYPKDFALSLLAALSVAVLVVVVAASWLLFGLSCLVNLV